MGLQWIRVNIFKASDPVHTGGIQVMANTAAAGDVSSDVSITIIAPTAAVLVLLVPILLLTVHSIIAQLNGGDNNNLSRMLLEHLRWTPNPAGEVRED